MTRSTFRQIKFDAARLAAGRLFGPEFDEDPWVVFHGTAASNGAAIENEGFTYDRHPLTSADIASINEVFVAMNWAGVDTEGFEIAPEFIAIAPECKSSLESQWHGRVSVTCRFCGIDIVVNRVGFADCLQKFFDFAAFNREGERIHFAA